MTDRPEVLFVCVHNAGRSQMAAALLDHHAQGQVVVRSAGSAPADTINPAVVTAMSELGIDLSKQFPKALTTDAVQASDVVITMGCGDACPVFPGKRYLDWQLDDPPGKTSTPSGASATRSTPGHANYSPNSSLPTVDIPAKEGGPHAALGPTSRRGPRLGSVANPVPVLHRQGRRWENDDRRRDLCGSPIPASRSCWSAQIRPRISPTYSTRPPETGIRCRSRRCPASRYLISTHRLVGRGLHRGIQRSYPPLAMTSRLQRALRRSSRPGLDRARSRRRAT